MTSPAVHGALPPGWRYEQVGTVLTRASTAEALSFDELVHHQVQASLDLGDERSPAELDAQIRAELELRVQEYGDQVAVSRG
ncbi:hypothetical protein ACFWNN_03295 [Lentzea sp. NPDC058450]|uniref:hypothetical protein n=1 Tax=Lentzea sp. NPDC058450 TaxID=3346505 RepID=UPI00365BE22B